MELFAKIGRKLVRDPQTRQMIALGKTPYWQRNKWRWNSEKTVLEGRFRTPYCAPKGKFSRHRDGTFTAYIIDPPEKLWRHPQKSCFYPTSEKDVYRVHFITSPQNHTIDACIQKVERVLVESFERRR
jgi:hypothetical protein